MDTSFINNTPEVNSTYKNNETSSPSTNGGITSGDLAPFLQGNVIALVLAAMSQCQQVSNKQTAVQSSNLQQTVFTEQTQAALLSKINYQNLTTEQKNTLDEAAKNDGQKEMSTSQILKDWWQGLWSKDSKADDGDTVKLWGNIWKMIKNDPIQAIGAALIVSPLSIVGIAMFVGDGIYNECKTGTWFDDTNKDIAVNTTAPGAQTDTSNITTELTLANDDIQKQRDTISNTLTVLGQQQSIQMTNLTSSTQTSMQNVQQIGSILQALTQISSAITAR